MTYTRSTLIKKSDGSTREHSLKHLFPLELSITRSHRTSEPHKDLSDSENISGIPADAVARASGNMLTSRLRRIPKRVSDRNEDYSWYKGNTCHRGYVLCSFVLDIDSRCLLSSVLTIKNCENGTWRPKFPMKK